MTSSNKYELADRGRLIKAKLDLVSKKLQGSLASSEFSTQEQLIFEAIKVVNSFYKDLQKPTIDLTEILVKINDYPNHEKYNKLWQYVLDDLTIVFSEFENVETLTLANFNLVVTETNRIVSRLKSVSSKLGDYILYSKNPLKDAIFFKDSFNDQLKIDINSSLLNAPQCNVNQTEGVITLPINTEKDPNVRIKNLPIINNNSNGSIGNSQEIGKAFNGTLTDITDNNADTWFEYEFVTTENVDIDFNLTLDLTLNLGAPQIINHIRINPNNFGTKKVVVISEIATSLDGIVYTSIKPDIPDASFVDTDNVFVLAPSTSKYAGQGLYSFSPRKVKYINVIFNQNESYLIETPNGPRLRYAIGIRDIELRSFSYLPKGEIVSLPFETISEIKKIALHSNQNPTISNELGTISYSISVDNGSSFIPITSLEAGEEIALTGIPQIITLNTAAPTAIQTSNPVYAIRLKATIERNDESFTPQNSSFAKVLKTTSEVHEVPQSAPYEIILNQTPVTDSVVVIDPMFGSRGIRNSPYIISRPFASNTATTYVLPFSKWPRPLTKVFIGDRWFTRQMATADWFHVEVDGEEWTHVTQGITTSGFYTSVDKVYSMDFNSGVLKFGNGIIGAKADPNASIAMYMDAERLFPSNNEDNHLAVLDFSTSASKDAVIISRYDDVFADTFILPKKAFVVKLPYKNVTNLGTIPSVFTGSQKTFINGQDELTTATDWSIDYTEGTIYSRTSTSANTNESITYSYQEVTELTTDDWEWGSSNYLRDSISIKQTAWKTRSLIEDAIIQAGEDFSGARVLDLPNLSIVKGTLKIALTGTTTLVEPIDPTSAEYPFVKEVAFIDGQSELGLAFVKNIESIPKLTSPLTSFVLAKEIEPTLGVTFSNTTLFATDVFPSIPTSSGEYSLNIATKAISVYTGSRSFNFTKTGTVNYFSPSPNYSSNGLYSVDYKKGIIYTQRPMDPSAQTDWSLLISYEFADFKAQYRVARLLPNTAYDIDFFRKTLTLNATEILRHVELPRSFYGKPPFYLVNYDIITENRESVEELTEFYTPVIKDYALKLITKDRLL